MFKKFTAALLLVVFTNVYAVTPVQQSMTNELNRTFDTLNYKLNVEWDQKDAKVFDETIADFEKEIANLQSEGLTTQDLVNYTSGKIKDKQIQNDIIEMKKVIADTQMSKEEARAFVIARLNSTYSEGASWSGRRMGLKVAILIGIIVIIIITTNRDHDKDRKHHDNCDGRDGISQPTYGCEYQTNGYPGTYPGNNNCCYPTPV